MGYLHKVHACPTPIDGNYGDIWQCEDCLQSYMKSVSLGWVPAVQKPNGQWTYGNTQVTVTTNVNAKDLQEIVKHTIKWNRAKVTWYHRLIKRIKNDKDN